MAGRELTLSYKITIGVLPILKLLSILKTHAAITELKTQRIESPERSPSHQEGSLISAKVVDHSIVETASPAAQT